MSPAERGRSTVIAIGIFFAVVAVLWILWMAATGQLSAGTGDNPTTARPTVSAATTATK